MIDFIQRALAEDIGNGDHTTMACVDSEKQIVAELRVKENGVLAGMEVAKEIFKVVDKDLSIQSFFKDGDDVRINDIAFVVEGRAHSILTAERLVLNMMQRMSGIATTTSKYVDIVRHTKVKLLDTRKTTPGIRQFEKHAVRLGGGYNHRIGLFDMILIKDNHVDASGGISIALQNAESYVQSKGLDLKIEIEVRGFDELNEALSLDIADRIMLDNFSVEDTDRAVKLVDGRVELESSGGINTDTIKGYAETGVDYISVGALTHSIKSLDLSLKYK